MVKWWLSSNGLLILTVLIWSWQKEFISAPIALAKWSRKAMKLHIPIAICGTTFIVIHAILMVINHPAYMTSLKFLSGFLALLMLILLLFTGYRRHYKATGYRRRSHIVMAFTFLTSTLLHIFI